MTRLEPLMNIFITHNTQAPPRATNKNSGMSTCTPPAAVQTIASARKKRRKPNAPTTPTRAQAWGTTDIEQSVRVGVMKHFSHTLIHFGAKPCAITLRYRKTALLPHVARHSSHSLRSPLIEQFQHGAQPGTGSTHLQRTHRCGTSLVACIAKARPHTNAKGIPDNTDT